MCNLHKYSTENLSILSIDKNAARPEGKRAAKTQVAQGFSEILNLVYIFILVNNFGDTFIKKEGISFNISNLCYAI